ITLQILAKIFSITLPLWKSLQTINTDLSSTASLLTAVETSRAYNRSVAKPNESEVPVRILHYDYNSRCNVHHCICIIYKRKIVDLKEKSLSRIEGPQLFE
ncbi:MAG: hypothetical protein KTM48_01250, partial [Wolbachia endosymbiont of Pissodes strobi]|nr:hypothetical protein [Wolbachia endosymbiont of Pissodes strobi]